MGAVDDGPWVDEVGREGVTALQQRLQRQVSQLATLQRLAGLFATMPKPNQIAGILTEIFVRELGARTSVVWFNSRQGSAFIPHGGQGLEKWVWKSMELPAPDPFPGAPMLLLQPQWLDVSVLPAMLAPLLGDGGGLLPFYVPFEYNASLIGLAILGIPDGRLIEGDLDILTILGHQAAASLFNSHLFRNLSEQKDQLESQVRDLERANAALQTIDKFKNEFLIITSHELRTPLTGVLGLLKLVLDGLYSDEDEMIQMLHDSYASGKYLLKLLNDILDLAKIESGQLRISPKDVSVEGVFAEIKIITGGVPKSPEVDLVWPAGLDALPAILVDPDRFTQVVVNLVSNALKFTANGSVKVSAERGIGHICFAVADTGTGISPKDQAQLFQKFVQADSGRTRGFGGSGLGLVIAKHLVELMGGEIALRSEGEGHGTTVSFTAPIA